MERNDGCIIILEGIFLAIVLMLVAFWDFAACSSKWSRSGMHTSWGIIQGCVVQVPDGRWIPEDRVREIDIQPKNKEMK